MIGWLAAAALLAGPTGCGPARPAVAPVAGTVTYRGKPVSLGTITFYPAHGRPGSGRIGPDGRYALTTFIGGDGAMPGEHTVVIEARTVTSPFATPSPSPVAATTEELIAREMVAVPTGIPGQTETWLVPEAYAGVKTTPLRATVTPGTVNTIDFALPAP